MTETPQQLVFDLPHRPALEEEDFIVSQSNAAADEMIARWPDWPGHALVICGPEGSGKTHLANVWRLRSGAAMVQAEQLNIDDTPTLATTAGLTVEDIDAVSFDERALFHLLNHARETGFSVLLTARKNPGNWLISLPDLRSRARSLPVIEIEQPDPELLAAVLVKLLNDRQIPATPSAVRHLARHMDRSMSDAMKLVEKIDNRLWDTPKEVTRDLARNVLAELRAEQT